MQEETTIRKRLIRLEKEMEAQTRKCMSTGWNSPDGLFWDARCIERRVLRRVLRMKEKSFNAADTMAGW